MLFNDISHGLYSITHIIPNKRIDYLNAILFSVQLLTIIQNTV